MPQLSTHAIAFNGVANGFTDNKTHLGRSVYNINRVDVADAVLGEKVHHEVGLATAASAPRSGAEILRSPQSRLNRQHGADASGRKAVAALAATFGDDAAAGASAHTQTEAVRLGTTAVVGLERALHGRNSRIRCFTFEWGVSQWVHVEHTGLANGTGPGWQGQTSVSH